MDTTNEHYILKINCPAASGIVAAITTCLAGQQCYISELAQFDDEFTGQFFMRAVFRFNTGVKGDIGALREHLGDLACGFDMRWQLFCSSQPTRVLLMVSKFDHCLTDLLYRHRKGEMDMHITAVVSNHLDLRAMAEREGIRFIYLPITKDSKASQEAELMRIVEDTQTDLVVLARYMQILSDSLCQQLSGRAINIHHSFLPGFKGARPYHQAHERGVKVIGATAHYVTAALDEGPIIEQDVERISHRDTPAALIRKGRDIERRVLARAVRWRLEDRVLLNGAKTVVFTD